jgi:hypothetical protein
VRISGFFFACKFSERTDLEAGGRAITNIQAMHLAVAVAGIVSVQPAFTQDFTGILVAIGQNQIIDDLFQMGR